MAAPDQLLPIIIGHGAVISSFPFLQLQLLLLTDPRFEVVRTPHEFPMQEHARPAIPVDSGVPTANQCKHGSPLMTDLLNG